MYKSSDTLRNDPDGSCPENTRHKTLGDEDLFAGSSTSTCNFRASRCKRETSRSFKAERDPAEFSRLVILEGTASSLSELVTMLKANAAELSEMNALHRFMSKVYKGNLTVDTARLRQASNAYGTKRQRE